MDILSSRHSHSTTRRSLMASKMPSEFESMCLSIEMGFYYKDTTDPIAMQFEKLSKKVVEEAIRDRSRSELVVLKSYLDELASGSHAAADLTKIWESTKPRVAFFGSTGAGGTTPAIVYIFELARAAVDARLANLPAEDSPASDSDG
ncbi:hypothetical protein [Methylosinus sp. Sm6]|uniref:hypothetical protein n=1 Tax=Methylosinus sp. Sm6 TaxID=2866948 RepID=UPI001C99D4A8|nr:hypothetical protein [Methylosinus sp. Sm6]MBY6239742.1 hypothetical protein [Methylosinus sp. Sm6]